MPTAIMVDMMEVVRTVGTDTVVMGTAGTAEDTEVEAGMVGDMVAAGTEAVIPDTGASRAAGPMPKGIRKSWDFLA